MLELDMLRRRLRGEAAARYAIEMVKLELAGEDDRRIIADDQLAAWVLAFHTYGISYEGTA